MQVILYTFPAICWAYGAGFIFSAFVSVVFWGGPALRLLETVRMHSATVRPAALTPASEVHTSSVCKLHGCVVAICMNARRMTPDCNFQSGLLRWSTVCYDCCRRMLSGWMATVRSAGAA